MTLRVHSDRNAERMEKVNRLNEMQMVLRRTVMEIERLTVQAAQMKKEISKLESEMPPLNVIGR